MANELSKAIYLTTMSCGKCGVAFAIPEIMRVEKERDGGSWYCPNGHCRVYKESDADKYKKLLEKEQREAASLRENMVAAQRAQVRAEFSIAKLKKRAAAGVCPCCNRTVSQLQRHMSSKHKEFLALNGMAPAKRLTENVQ